MTIPGLLSLPIEISNVIIGKLVTLSNGRLIHLARLMLTCKRLYYQCLPTIYGSCLFEVSGPITYLLALALNPRTSLSRPETFRHIKALSVRGDENWFEKWSSPRPQKLVAHFHMFDSLKSLNLHTKAAQIHHYINQKTPQSIKTLTLHIIPTKLLPCQCLTILGAIDETHFLLDSLAIIIKRSSLAPELPPMRPRFDADYRESAFKLTKCRVVYGIGLRSFDGLIRSFQTVFPRLRKTKITTNIGIGRLTLAIAQKSCSTLTFMRMDNFDAAYVFMDYREMFTQIPADLISGFEYKIEQAISLPLLECIVLDLSSFVVSKRWCVLFCKLNWEHEQQFKTVCILHDHRCESLCVIELDACPLKPDAQWSFFRVSKDFSANFFSSDCYLSQKNRLLSCC